MSSVVTHLDRDCVVHVGSHDTLTNLLGLRESNLPFRTSFLSSEGQKKQEMVRNEFCKLMGQ